MRAAIDFGVDIISMSWTIEKTSDNETDIRRLEETLQEAAKQKILLFCSSNDEITSSNGSHPSHDKTRFKIGAATAHGKISQYTQSEEVDFIFPGDKVIRERYDSVLDTNSSLVSGSSVATALAAGLAALVLYCVQFSVYHVLATDRNVHIMANERVQAVKDRDRMKQVFQAIGEDHQYIKVWDMFRVACIKMEGKDRSIQREIISDLTQSITRGRSF